MIGLFELYSFSPNPMDARGLSIEELQLMTGSKFYAMQQAATLYPLDYVRALAQYQPRQRPLDERFADFKVRLAAAIERRRVG